MDFNIVVDPSSRAFSALVGGVLRYLDGMGLFSSEKL